MMTREERAKQFAPFDAMKGLQAALRDREERHLRTPRREISEEDASALSAELQKVTPGAAVAIEYYRAFHDTRRLGTVRKIDPVFRYLVVDDERIFFDDIYRLAVSR